MRNIIFLDLISLLWNRFGSAVPFVFGAIMSAVAALLLIIFFRTPQKQKA